jgi:hypothetical protein
MITTVKMFIGSETDGLVDQKGKIRDLSSVADPDDFCLDPDPTFQIGRVRIRILAHINLYKLFPTRNFWPKSGF